MPMGKKWPPLLRILSEELGYVVRAQKAALGYELFAVDLSSWKLRLADRTPVISKAWETWRASAT